jgi:hypothetical protein
MQVQIKDKNLVIALPLVKRLSSTGKTYIVASTRGFQDTGVEFQGQPVSILVNATIDNPDKPKETKDLVL